MFIKVFLSDGDKCVVSADTVSICLRRLFFPRFLQKKKTKQDIMYRKVEAKVNSVAANVESLAMIM